ncbi:MAG: UTP--glucose-1-phosphate uridylyltransferase [Chloroflexi bacterium]|nr:UTP--glucose-1-phosphate uridylyltransferase [Chloroflexota bacterium]
MSHLIDIITSSDPSIRDQSLDAYCRPASLKDLLAECAALDTFRRKSDNLYERVRALFFLYAIHRFHLPTKPGLPSKGLVSFEGYGHLLSRRFEEAIEVFLAAQEANGPSDGISSALAVTYHNLAFQTLAGQVRRSVRSVRGNQWMFRMGHPADHPLRIRPELLRDTRGLRQDDGNGQDRKGLESLTSFPILRERTPVRMDLSHSGWSDIFFLGMDFPEGARVLNVSIDLAVVGRDSAPKPPVEAYLRVIDEPVLKLASVDLGTTATITDLAEVFDFAKDYLGLLKAAIIAAGIIPPGIEGSGQSLAHLLEQVVGPGLGLEIVSNVNNIPKGSRLAVSTNLLASLISVCMRATGQAKSLTGPLQEHERRLVAARAILGEWLGGSGGGWQDSGGLWPGIKLIQGERASEGDPEFGISRGRLLPSHKILDDTDAPPQIREKLQNSLVLVHGGMAQNVGPILEMVTEKYLLRSEAEWRGRHQAMQILDEILLSLRATDTQPDPVRIIGAATTRNFMGPIQTIIPWTSNLYTETLIQRVQAEYRDQFWGFWMLGGMSGGGMGFIFAPAVKQTARLRLNDIMCTAKQELEHALPFAMDPVVYDFSINQHGTYADLLVDEEALLPSGYYAMIVPHLLRIDQRTLSRVQRDELDRFAAACRTKPELSGMVQLLFDRLLPRTHEGKGDSKSLGTLLDQSGFDHAQHEFIRSELRSGLIGLAQNRLPANATIQDVRAGDVYEAHEGDLARELRDIGTSALAGGAVAVVSLAAGAGSRWTQGAGVVKALHPFCKMGGRHRSFIEVHLAKSRRVGRACGTPLPHIITTSYLTHKPIEQYLAHEHNYGYPGQLLLSPGRAIGLRMIPMVRDLRFAWEEMPQQILDEQKQKMRESLHHALIEWAHQAGEGSDYTDNLPLQCLHPVGHWYEIPNLLRNGVLKRLLEDRPQLRYLMLHNIDTLGANVDPTLLGLHVKGGACLTYEVITRRIDDRGGGLARVDGRLRLVEGLAMPREEDEFALSYYNTMTTWVDIDKLLAVFALTRADLANEEQVTTAIRTLAARMPTYITLKDVKKRWGHGQEDIFPVTQFEKLWGDMTALPDVECRFVVVPRTRGQQLKDQAQLDGWLRDGSAAYVESLCEWD